MSDTRDPETDQQLPQVNSNPYIQDLLIKDLEKRKQHGIRKYGTALQAGNGRDMTLDAYEEVMDLAVYLRGRLEERSQVHDMLIHLWTMGHRYPVIQIASVMGIKGPWDE